MDPLRAKYAGMSPYNYSGDNPINALDKEGDDVILLIWASQDKNVGHSAVAISNYKTVEKKVKEKGKWITRKVQVPDGTYSVRDLWPTIDMDRNNFWQTVGANYKHNEEKKFTLDQLINTDVTNAEKQPADGVIQFKTDVIKDTEVNRQLDEFEISKNYYNTIYNNCSDYVRRALTTVAGDPRIDTDEKADKYSITTSNQLYKSAMHAPGAIILKDAGTKVKVGSLEKATGDNVEKAVKQIPD